MSLKHTALILGAALALCAGGSQAQVYHTLYHFKGADGDKPVAPLIVDGSGTLFGATEMGGANGAGTVFRLGAGKSEAILHSFTGSQLDGCGPWGGITTDGAGNLYGVTVTCGLWAKGTVFEVTPGGDEHVLYSFGYPNDGAFPGNKPLVDAAGNVYGVTPYGGGGPLTCQQGCGIVYRIAPDGSETVLHAFDYDDGATPFGELTADGAGNLYGTTMEGGAGNGGTIFKLAPDGRLTTLYAFHKSDSKRDNRVFSPSHGLLRDAAGNLYGVAGMKRPAHDTNCAVADCGAIFVLSPKGNLRVLHAFGGGKDGAGPNSTLVMDAAGSLYGTTARGGNKECEDKLGCGTVFRTSPDGSFAILHVFTSRQGTPNGVTLGADGTLYGAAFHLAKKTSGDGLVFRIDP